MSGSVPPRPSAIEHPQPPLGPAGVNLERDAKDEGISSNPPQARVPVYGTRETLERLSSAYGGGLWPELGHWAKEEEELGGGQRKRRRVVETKPTDGCGVVLTPYVHVSAPPCNRLRRQNPPKLTWIQSPPIHGTSTFTSLVTHHDPHFPRRSWMYISRIIRIIGRFRTIRSSSHTQRH